MWIWRAKRCSNDGLHEKTKMSELNKLFKERKKNKKSSFIGFVTSGDPNYKSSKEIMKEMTKYCQVIEAGVSFNTSTSDSPIIMEANDRAIKSGMNMSKTFKLISEVKKETKTDTPFVLMTYLNPIIVYGIKKFIKSCQKTGIAGVIIVDASLNSPEEKFIINGLTKKNIGYIKIISPTNSEKFIQSSIKNCKNSWIYITSYYGLTGSKNVNIQNVRKLVKIVRKYSKDIPIGVGFGIKTSKQIKDVSKYADATIVGSAIVNKIKEGTENGKYGRNLATFIGSYLKKLTK